MGRRSYQYVTVPVSLRLEMHRFFVKTGLYASYLTGYTYQPEYDHYKAEELAAHRQNDTVFDYGLSAGVGYHWAIGQHWNLEFAVRYRHGLNNVLREESVFEVHEVFNRTTSLVFGISRSF